jgi:hypothetical protein
VSKPVICRGSPLRARRDARGINDLPLAWRMRCKLAMVLRIELQHSDAETVLTLIGRISSLDVQQLKVQIERARSPVALDLREVRLVSLDAVRFLAVAERSGIELRHLPQYVREWILLERPRVRAAEQNGPR